MRTPIIAGNWKMNTTLEEGKALARAIRERGDSTQGVEKVVCPPFVSLEAIGKVLAGSTIAVGAQNTHEEPKGAFTGEVSIEMLRDLVKYVIVGHSERRTLFGETDAGTAAKARAIAGAGLRAIVCVGETLEVRESGNAVETVRNQLAASLDGFDTWGSLVVAYEPVWAIGTGRAASPEIAEEMMGALRTRLAELSDSSSASNTPILYGGSVNASNIALFMEQPDVDGALVGGASLDAEEFCRILGEASATGM